MKEIFQYTLGRDDFRLTCWLDKKLRPGQRITLKDAPKDEWWVVLEAHGASTLEFLDSHRKWNNNI